MRAWMFGVAAAFLGLAIAVPAQANDLHVQRPRLSVPGHYDYTPGHADRTAFGYQYTPGHFDYHRGPDFPRYGPYAPGHSIHGQRGALPYGSGYHAPGVGSYPRPGAHVRPNGAH